MKKGIVILLVVLFSAAHANAQMAGLPIADSAVPLEAEMKRASAGFVIGDDFNMYGGRFSYGLADDFSVFGDFGFVDPDRGDTGWGIQIGGLYGIPVVDLPFDLAARGTLGYANLDQKFRVFDPATGRITTRTFSIDIITSNIGALASTDVDMMTLYGYLGLNYMRISNGGSDSEFDPAVGGGALFNATEQASIYLELMHIDDLWLGLGFRYAF